MEEKEYLPIPEKDVGEKEKKERQWLPIKEVARITGYSDVRLRHLCKLGKLPFNKLYREKGKRGAPWRYVVRAADVLKYKLKLPSFKEMGSWKEKLGKRKRGRPKKRIGRRGVVFQGA